MLLYDDSLYFYAETKSFLLQYKTRRVVVEKNRNLIMYRRLSTFCTRPGCMNDLPQKVLHILLQKCFQYSLHSFLSLIQHTNHTISTSFPALFPLWLMSFIRNTYSCVNFTISINMHNIKL